MVCLSTGVSTYERAGVASGTNDSFDVEMAIAELLADPSRTSLELPCLLSAEQRKHAKKVVEQHPDLKCESFGLGKDRQMHLFKCKLVDKSAKGDQIVECSPQRVSVKNTFINDWIENSPADERVVQSMPHNMFGKCLSLERSRCDLPTVEGQGSTSRLADEAESIMPQSANGVLEEDQLFALGTEVVIDGLVKAPSFNGAIGVVQSWDADSGRYNILLASATTAGQQWAKIKGVNLRQA